MKHVLRSKVTVTPLQKHQRNMLQKLSMSVCKTGGLVCATHTQKTNIHATRTLVWQTNEKHDRNKREGNMIATWLVVDQRNDSAH